MSNKQWAKKLAIIGSVLFVIGFGLFFLQAPTIGGLVLIMSAIFLVGSLVKFLSKS